jgi:hypothetical protein
VDFNSEPQRCRVLNIGFEIRAGRDQTEDV